MAQLLEKQERSLVSNVQRMLGSDFGASPPAAPTAEAEDGDDEEEVHGVVLKDGYQRKTPIQAYRIVPRRGVWLKVLLALIGAAVVVVTSLKIIGWI